MSEDAIGIFVAQMQASCAMLKPSHTWPDSERWLTPELQVRLRISQWIQSLHVRLRDCVADLTPNKFFTEKDEKQFRQQYLLTQCAVLLLSYSAT